MRVKNSAAYNDPELITTIKFFKEMAPRHTLAFITQKIRVGSKPLPSKSIFPNRQFKPGINTLTYFCRKNFSNSKLFYSEEF